LVVGFYDLDYQREISVLFARTKVNI